jgi:hypothetical protein
MPQRIAAPDGSFIDFPDNMSNEQIGSVMQRQYPPKQSAANVNWQSSAQFSGPMASARRPGTPAQDLERAASQDEANNYIERTQPKFHVSARPNTVMNRLEDTQAALSNEMERGVGPIGHMLPGVLVGEGALKVAHGLGNMPSHPLRGVNETLDGGLSVLAGAMPFAAPLMPAAMSMEILPSLLPYAATGAAGQAGFEHVGQKMGLDPEVNKLLSSLATFGVMGAAGGRGALRERMVKSLAENLRARGGVDESLIPHIAERMVSTYEATGDPKHLMFDEGVPPSALKSLSHIGQNLVEGAQAGAEAVTMRTQKNDLPEPERPSLGKAPHLDRDGMTPVDTMVRRARGEMLPDEQREFARGVLNYNDNLERARQAGFLPKEATPSSTQESSASPETTKTTAASKDLGPDLSIRSAIALGHNRVYVGFDAPPDFYKTHVTEEGGWSNGFAQKLFPGKDISDARVVRQQFGASERGQHGLHLEFGNEKDAADAVSELNSTGAQPKLSGEVTPSGQETRPLIDGKPVEKSPEQKFAEADKPRKPGPDDPERGSLSFRRRIPTSDSPLGKLTEAIDRGIQARPARGDRLSIAETISRQYAGMGDDIGEGLSKLLAHSVGLYDKWRRPEPFGEYDKALGEFSGDLQRNAIDTRRFVHKIIDKVPNAARREAITNFIQANGDAALLQSRERATTNPRLKKGYALAQQLSPEEMAMAQSVRDYFDHQLQIAQAQGVLDHGLENYVNQVWKKPGQRTDMTSAIYNQGLRPNADLMKRRFYADYFTGEQMGLVPKNKDIGYLIGVYNQSFNQAIASRGFIEKLSNGMASDQRPLVAPPALIGKTIPGDQVTPETHLLMLRGVPEERLEGYQPIEHPALKGWNWASTGELGDQTFFRGNLLVHPEIYDKLNNSFRTSWFRRNPTARAILKGQGMLKSTLLSASFFHQVQEGWHAIFHKVSPFGPAEIDLRDPQVNKLLDHGLIVGGDNGMQAFNEGLQGSGLLKFIPGVSQMMNKYSDYLFGDYIPRLKVAMAKGAAERNMARYADHIAQGRITEDQVYKMSAEQSNAAFGELNYKMLGRNPNLQDGLRLALLAPDFLEARGRFIGQALKPYGREQQAALVRGAVGMWVTARIVNQLVDKDPHYDVPFGIVVNGRQYEMRSIPGDIDHLMTDPRSFVYHRLSPTITRPAVEALFGKDSFGRKRNAGQQVLDYVKNIVPIPLQGLYDKATGHGTAATDPLDTALESVGISSHKYRTPAEAMSRKIVLDSMSPTAQSKGMTALADRIRDNKVSQEELQAQFNSGKFADADIKRIVEMSAESELIRNFKNQNVHMGDAAAVYMLANKKERIALQPEWQSKIKNYLKSASPDDRKRLDPILQKIQKQDDEMFKDDSSK